MHIRPKTVRRMLLLAAACGLAGVTVSTAFYARRHARDELLASQRDAGFTAYAAGDFAKALPPLQEYIIARPTDVDALFALGASREAVEAPNRDNLFEARSRFQQVLLQQPTHLEAKRRLIDIYERTGLTRELLAIADDVLASKVVTDDAILEALRGRAVALSRLERSPEAVAAWQAYLAKAPTDFRAQAELLDVMHRGGAKPDEVVAYARQQVDAHPGDARFELPLAIALRDAGRDAEANAILTPLAQAPQHDADLVIDLVATLDRGHSFEEAERLLTRAADSMGSASVSTALVQRMWLSGRHTQVLATTERLLADGRREPGLLAFRALSLDSQNRRAEASALVDQLRAMTQDAVARAWADALAVDFSAEPLTPAQKVATLRDSLSRDPTNGIVYTWLARALVQVGEIDQAARCYRESAQRLPSWATPCVELSQTMLNAGRVADAVSSAKAAYLRSPNATSTLVQVIRVRYAELQGRGDAQAEAALLADVERLRQRVPGEATLLPIHVALLARQGRSAEADTLVQAALPADATPALIADLYAVARRGGLSVGQTVFDYAAANKLLTPQFARLRAIDLATQNGPPAGLALMSAQKALHPNDPAWALADARVRLALRDPAAANVWKDMVSTYPGDVAVQSAAIAEAPTFVGDRAAQAAVVERLHAIVGESGTEWRLARVRFLGLSADPEDLRLALSIGTDLVRQHPGRTDLRIELARVLVRLDSATTAVDHVRAAFEQTPGDAAIGLELVRTLRLAGRSADVPAVLKRLASYDYDDAAARLQVATALADAGLYDEVAALLGRTQAWQPLDPASRRLLAEVQANRGEMAAAAPLFKSLATDDHASAASLVSAAAFERRAGHLDAATELLTRAESTDEPVADREHALARYDASFANADEAAAHYANALEQPEADAALFAEASTFESTRGRADRAELVLARGEAKFPNDAMIHRARLQLNARREAGDAAGPDHQMAALIATMNADAASQPEAQALQALDDARKLGKPTPELAARLSDLAAIYPASIDLARQAVSTYLAIGHRDGAANVAYRILAANDPRAEDLELAARTLVECDQLKAARNATMRWRTATDPADSLGPDQTLAEIALREGKPADAIAVLAPHRETLRWPADAAAFSTLATALVRTNAATDAFALIEPALTSEASARALWVSIALVGDDISAVSRFDQLEAATPQGSIVERLRLAAAYLAVAERGETIAPAQRGLATLATLPASALRSPRAAGLYGELLRTSGDDAKALAALRAALAAAPADAGLKNAVAYLLLADPTTAAEAVKLADEAARAVPSNAGFLDTLARANAAAGDFGRAEATFRKAIALDADCVDAEVGLATLYARQGKSDLAQSTMRQIDEAFSGPKGSPIPRHLRGELAALRQSVTSAPAN